jgi:hypothetical protein
MLREGSSARCSRLNTGEPRMGLYHGDGVEGGRDAESARRVELFATPKFLVSGRI